MYEPIFAGFDPFLEDQVWAEFHNGLITYIHDHLARLLVPLYQVRAESYIHLMRPVISIFRGRMNTEPLETSSLAISPATRLITPTIYELDEPLRIEIYNALGKLVTVIEVLSGSNKEGAGYERYLVNRSAILNTDTHLVEIDLLRSGKRLEKSFPQEGYVILVARAIGQGDHIGEVYEIGLRDSLPIIPIPLDSNYPDVPLDLPSLVKQKYINARYRLGLNYQQMPRKKFSPSDQLWINEQLSHAFPDMEFAQ